MPIIVELTRSFRKYMHLHFQSLGISKADAIIIESREKWYGIIDERHVHAAM